ncbi:hypothetical protein VM57_00305 [Stenotrophomonas maltophilia]|uniref:Uncharacterized protein n=1 Tax=Stenotrophomonas maltophilia TaxID=40324 RepID=A0A0F5ZPX6_STEMA|nr:hypothetical protein VM57_00305 [Stenotrophomonas maltophilia]
MAAVGNGCICSGRCAPSSFRYCALSPRGWPCSLEDNGARSAGQAMRSGVLQSAAAARAGNSRPATTAVAARRPAAFTMGILFWRAE